TVNAFLPWC
ncbi:putative membrane protein, partial [Escherichia coli EC1865]